MSHLSLYLLGSPHVSYKGRSVKLDTRKTLALLIFLAATHRNHRRDSMVTLLWPESNQARGLALLRHSLYVLRKTMNSDLIKADRDTVGMNPDAGLWIDVGRFRELLAECGKHGHGENEVCARCLKPLDEAVGLYCDNFLNGFSLKDSVDFGNWQLTQSRSLLRHVLRHSFLKHF